MERKVFKRSVHLKSIENSGNVIKPFWNDSCSIFSSKFSRPYPVDIEKHDLHSKSQETSRKSWFSIKTLVTLQGNNVKFSSETISSLRPESKKELTRATKIKLNPSKTWIKTLNRWLGTSRWTYNRCLDLFKTKKCKMSRKDFRSKVIGSHNYGVPKKRTGKSKKKRGKNRGNWGKKAVKVRTESKTSWVLETPMEIRDGAMDDLIKAFESNMAKKKINPEHHFDLSFRSRKSVQTIKIPGKCVKEGKFFKSFVGTSASLGSYEDFKDFHGEIKIQKDRIGDLYMIVIKKVTSSDRHVNPNDLKVVALDPGVRTFNTSIDSDGSILEFAPGEISRIYRLCHYMDLLQSKAFDVTKYKSRSRYRMRKAWHRSIKRIKDLVTEVHRKSVNLLCSKYDVIFLPRFESSEMCNRAGRHISKKTARAMMTWSHFRFKELLKSKALETGSIVVDVTEEYTSKTCSCCGNIHSRLGSSKVFSCPSCGIIMDRDVNGARNILFKSCCSHNMDISFPVNVQ